MIKIKPFLKWAGNKYRCLEHILGSLPPANRFIEPFTGSAAIFLNVQYPDYLLAEANSDLVYLFQCLQADGASFITFCEPFFSQANNCESQYYLFRDKFNKSTDRTERAALFLYLNRHGYNGLCRYNQKGIYNVPFGRYIKPYFPRAEMTHFHHKSKQATFIHGDFRDTFAEANPGDIIYCDPPYAPLEQFSNFSSYTHTSFGEKEQIILAELAMEAAGRGITVAISNHDTPVTRQHYQHSHITSFPVMRSISCRPENRGPVQELLAVFQSR